MADDALSESAAGAGESTRRTFLQAIGLTSGAAMLGATGEASARSTATGGDQWLDLGGRRVVGDGGYDTIQVAWDAAESGDVVYVHSSYDAAAAGEQFPIVLDYEQKEVTLTGGHPSGSVIDAGGANANVIEVIGRGMNDYRNDPVVRNLKIVGGQTGLRIRAAPFSSYANLVFYRNGEHGAVVDGYTDPDTGREKGSFGVTFENCQAWVCGGSGFRTHVDAAPHGATFDNCVVTWCGRDGAPGVLLRGYASSWRDGIVQMNAGFGIDVRRGGSQRIAGTYFEGNGQLTGYPIDVYAARSTELLVENCYLYGHYASGPFAAESDFDQCRRAVNFHGTQGASVRNCTYRGYSDCFVRTQGGAHEIDVHSSSHYGLDGTQFLSRGHSERVRDDGVILETDLRDSSEAGQYVGDRGIHDGSGDGAWGLALWNGSEWISVMDGDPL